MKRQVSPIPCLILLGAGLGYAVFASGGVAFTEWNVCLLIIGSAAIAYCLRTPALSLTPAERPWLASAVLLLPAYVALQLVPLPRFLLGIVSPARAQLLENLGKVTESPAFAPLSVAPEATSAYLFRIIACTLVFFLIRQMVRRSYWRPWTAALCLIAIAALEAGWGLLKSAGGAPVEGTYANKNHFSGLLEMVLPLTLALACKLLQSGLYHRAPSISAVLKGCGLLGVATVLLLAVVYSMSKMGFVAGLFGVFVLGALALCSWLEAWRKRLALAGLGALVFLFLVFLPPDELIRHYGSLLSAGDPTESRGPIAADTVQLIAAYPVFGSGLGTYATAFQKHQTADVNLAFDFAHNDYLQLAAELGGVGLMILASLLVSVFVKAVRAASDAPDLSTQWLGLGCAGGLAAISLHSLADFNLYIPANALVLAWICGLAAGLPLVSFPRPTRDRAVRGQLVAKGFAIALGGLLVLYAPAWILFDTVFRSDPRAERFFCRFGICDTDAVLAAQTLEHGGKITAVPTAELVEALRRDAAGPHRWCDLGEAALQSGRTAEARYCFSNALALGPNIPPTLLRAANFYQDVQENQRALDQTSHVLRKTAAYDNLIFDWYTARKLALTDILNHGLAEGPRVPQAYFRYLMDTASAGEAQTAWDWVAGHGYADDRLATEYLDFLLRDKKYETAARSWALYLGPRRNGYLESDWLFNGDFEFAPSGSVFDWRIDSRGGVEVARDQSVAHSGAWSLRIRFDGTENVTDAGVAQTAFVTPGAYRFAACIRTENLTTDQGAAFRVFDPEAPARLDLRTESFSGTHNWQTIEQIVSVPRQTRLLQVRVVRQSSWKFDNKVRGAVWIDTVSLSPVGTDYSAMGTDYSAPQRSEVGRAVCPHPTLRRLREVTHPCFPKMTQAF